MLSRSGCLLLAVLLSSGTIAAQSSQENDRRRAAMDALHHAAERYRGGDTAGALRLVDELDRGRQDQALQKILADLNAPVRGQDLAPAPEGDWRKQADRRALPWDHALLGAFAALHMEAALAVFTGEDDSRADAVDRHIGIASRLFARITADTRQPDATPRWLHAIGLTGIIVGRLGFTARVLDEACRTYASDVRLRVACGAVHEQMAMLPVRELVRDTASGISFHYSGYGPVSQRTLQTARGLRKRQLDEARRHFEKALALDARDSEAKLRLAHVRALAGDDVRARPVLEALVEDAGVDARTAYLARLFLGDLHRRAQQFDRAAALYDEAIALVPSAQSAYVARGFVDHARHDAAGAAVVAERMLAAPVEPDDPWWKYGLGEFWLRDRLVEALRAEARTR